MSKINNQAIVQKLIDELGLYPGIDIIPTELAEKILPCFLVNSQEITMTTEPATIVRDGLIEGSSADVTMYTVPATGKFFLTNVAMTMFYHAASSTGTGPISTIYLTPKGDSQRNLLTIKMDYTGEAAQREVTSNALNLQNPLELEPGTTIVLTQSAANNSTTSGNMVGYTSD